MTTRSALATLCLALLLQACAPQPEPAEVQYTLPADPNWHLSANWYQIFPERFANGDPSNDPTRDRINAPEGWTITPWTSDWYALLPWQQAVSDEFYRTATTRRYGGDLQGVIDRLEYLADLGVNAIYFNPVFDAVSMHKYDGGTYHHIDRFFGPDPEGDAAIMATENPNDPSTWQWTSADKLFLKFLNEAKKSGMRVVIDGVWNHTGPDFWAFRDVVANQQESPFHDWYTVTSWDDPATPDNEFDYQGWWGYKGLPEFRDHDNGLPDPVRDYIFASTQRWMDPNGDGDPSDGIDGWRLDVAEEVGNRFWLEWHNHVRTINPNAVTIAEIWTDRAIEYVNDSLFTLVMNYRWAYPTVDFFINGTESPSGFARRQLEVYQSWPEPVRNAMQNLLDSHDTDRLFSMIVNPGREYDRQALPRDNPAYNVSYPGIEARETLMLMALFQYTWPGAPMIYYGTEAGMWGADDPDDRKPMLWPDLVYEPEARHPLGLERSPDSVRFDHELYQWYQMLMKTRSEHESLRLGDVKVVVADDQTGLFGYTRTFGDETMLTILNPSADTVSVADAIPAERWPDVAVLVGGMTAGMPGGTVTGYLPPRSGMLVRLLKK